MSRGYSFRSIICFTHANHAPNITCLYREWNLYYIKFVLTHHPPCPLSSLISPMFPSSSSIILRLLPASPQTTPRLAGPPRFATGAHDSPPGLEGTKVRERNRGGELARKHASKRKGMKDGKPAGRQHDGGRGQQSTGTLIPLGKIPLFPPSL